MPIVKVDNHQVNINIQGRGEPMLFLHGVPDSSEVWHAVMKNLSGDFQCFAPDLPGFGLTKTSGKYDYHLDSLADFINGLTEVLQIQSRLHLVIHDIGGIVGLAFATKYPEKVKSLTIMDTTFFSDHSWHKLATIWRKPVLGDLAMHLMGYKAFYKAMKKAAPVLTAQQIRANYDKLSFKNRRRILDFYRTLDPNVFLGWEDQLLKVTSSIPSQVIWGKKDAFLPASLAKRFGAKHVYVLDEVGHWPMLERATEVTELIRAQANGIAKESDNAEYSTAD